MKHERLINAYQNIKLVLNENLLYCKSELQPREDKRNINYFNKLNYCIYYNYPEMAFP